MVNSSIFRNNLSIHIYIKLILLYNLQYSIYSVCNKKYVIVNEPISTIIEPLGGNFITDTRNLMVNLKSIDTGVYLFIIYTFKLSQYIISFQ